MHGPTTSVRALAIAAACLASAIAIPPAPAFADTASQLSHAREELSVILDRIDRERAAIASDQAQAGKLAHRLDLVQDDIARTDRAIIGVRRAIVAEELNVAATQAQLNQRAWVAYEGGPAGAVDFVLGSTSLPDLTERVQLLDFAAQDDARLLATLRSERDALAARQGELARLRRSQDERRVDLQREWADVQAKLTDAQATLHRLSGDEARAQQLVAELRAKQAAERLAAERLAAAVTTGPPGGGSVSVAGFLFICPVDQPRVYTDTFGAPRPGHLHMGDDIAAPLGTPIRAPFSGTAVASSSALGGTNVTVYGSQGYVFNAHLARLGTLGPVAVGTIVGYVGATGDAVGPHDHFEWHPDVIPSHPLVGPYGSSIIEGAIDPTPYLNSVC